MKFAIHDILPGSDASYIIVRPVRDRGFMDYVAAVLEVVAVLPIWPGYTPVIHWPDGEGRNLFYRYFKLRFAGFRFYSEQELIPGWQKSLREQPLQRSELLAGSSQPGTHFVYDAEYNHRDKLITADLSPLFATRLTVTRAARGYYQDKFKKDGVVVGVDTRRLGERGLQKVCEAFEDVLRNNVGVRMWCSVGDQGVYDFLVDRYGPRVYSRKKNDTPTLRDVIMETTILSCCDYILGTRASSVFTTAKVLHG